MFHVYDKKFISVTSHALYPLPLSQTVTPSRTPPPCVHRDVLYGRPPKAIQTTSGLVTMVTLTERDENKAAAYLYVIFDLSSIVDDTKGTLACWWHFKMWSVLVLSFEFVKKSVICSARETKKNTENTQF